MPYLEGLLALLHVEDLEGCLDLLKFMPMTPYDMLETCLGGCIRFVSIFSSLMSPNVTDCFILAMKTSVINIVCEFIVMIFRPCCASFS